MRKHIHVPVFLLASLAACGVAADKSESRVASSTGSAVAPATPPVATGFVGSDAPKASYASADAPAPEMASRAANTASGPRLGGATLGSATDLSGAMLVRQGEATLEVKGLDAGVSRVRQAAAQHGGFVANTTLRNGRAEQRGATLEVRVPTAQFDALLASLPDLGKVESVTASAQDVGEEYVDIGARVANAKRVEARLVEMIATRTGKLSEVLTVEQELTRVREEIERQEARMRYLDKRASLSTLSLVLHEPLGLIDNPRPGPIAEALGVAWMRFVELVAFCIASLGVIIPLAVLAGLVVVMVRRVWNKRLVIEG